MRQSSAIVYLALLAMLVGCDRVEPETFEECVARQTEYIESIPASGHLRAQFIYDVSDVEDLLVKVRGLEGLKISFVQGNSDPALEAFTDNNREPGPAVFSSSNGISLFRTAPVTMPHEELAERSCQPPFEGAKLIRTVLPLTPVPTEEESN